MLDERQYKELNGWREVMELFEKTQVCVVDVNPMLDFMEKENLSGGMPITRGCAPCTAGFLKWGLSMLRLYERNANTTQGGN